jgi:asparagine synthase (glutamine-hydrolysing)
LFEGEDRNRFYFWSVAPFYALPFFRYAMSCPSRDKRDLRLYSAFLRELAPRLLDIPNATMGRDPNQPMFSFSRLARMGLDRTPRRVKEAVKRLVNPPPIPKLYARCVNTQLRKSAAGELLDAASVNRLMRRWRRTEAETLLTVTSLVEYLTSGSSSLEEFGETPIV